VTVATLHSINQQPPGELVDDIKQAQITNAWKNVMERASKMPEWPKHSLKLRLDSAQIGSRAGILLWKESTGGLASMRECIQRASHQSLRDDEDGLFSDNNNVSIDTLVIPSIVHSTFLRFYQTPSTPAATVRSRFQKIVVPRLHDFFPQDITVSTATLVCERAPFMHIPFDSRHVLETYELEKDREPSSH
jgi:hypothetical protein